MVATLPRALPVGVLRSISALAMGVWPPREVVLPRCEGRLKSKGVPALVLSELMGPSEGVVREAVEACLDPDGCEPLLLLLSMRRWPTGEPAVTLTWPVVTASMASPPSPVPPMSNKAACIACSLSRSASASARAMIASALGP